MDGSEGKGQHLQVQDTVKSGKESVNRDAKKKQTPHLVPKKIKKHYSKKESSKIR